MEPKKIKIEVRGLGKVGWVVPPGLNIEPPLIIG